MMLNSFGKRRSVLLASAAAGGTIAAVRHLGAAGIDVRVLASQRLGAAAWSRFVSWRRRCPNIETFEITGEHLTLSEPENIGSFRAAFIAGTNSWRGGTAQQA